MWELQWLLILWSVNDRRTVNNEHSFKITGAYFYGEGRLLVILDVSWNRENPIWYWYKQKQLGEKEKKSNPTLSYLSTKRKQFCITDILWKSTCSALGYYQCFLEAIRSVIPYTILPLLETFFLYLPQLVSLLIIRYLLFFLYPPFTKFLFIKRHMIWRTTVCCSEIVTCSRKLIPTTRAVEYSGPHVIP